MTVALYLMTKKGLKSLEALVAAELQAVIEVVVVGRDKNIKCDYAAEIIALCTSQNIPWAERKTQITISSSYAIAISWRWLIHLGNCELLVFHDSLLPKYRGFAPLVNQLIAGDATIGVTALFATEQYDCGDIIAQEQTEIKFPIIIADAIEIVSGLYQKLICNITQQLANRTPLPRRAQIEADATYSLWRDAEDYFIDWSQSASHIRRHIDAVGFPYQGAKTRLKDEIITIEKAEEWTDVNIVNRTSGKVIFIRDNYPVVVCGTGLLQIKAAKDANGDSVIPLKQFRVRFQ
ncbi:MAG: methionyl-tRNA formyltransferase [Saprospiraceae bacterium]